MAAATFSYSGSFVGGARNFLNRLDWGLDVGSRIFGLAGAISDVASRAIRAGSPAASSAAAAGYSFSEANNVILLTRSVIGLGRLFTGALFLQTEKDGSLKVENGNYVLKPYLDTAASVCFLAYRVLSSVVWLGGKRVYQITTTQSQKLTQSLTALLGAAIVLSLASAAKALTMDAPRTDLAARAMSFRSRAEYERKATADLFVSTFDMISWVGCAMVTYGAYNLKYAGLGISILADSSAIVQEFLWYRPA